MLSLPTVINLLTSKESGQREKQFNHDFWLQLASGDISFFSYQSLSDRNENCIATEDYHLQSGLPDPKKLKSQIWPEVLAKREKFNDFAKMT